MKYHAFAIRGVNNSTLPMKNTQCQIFAISTTIRM